jgi:hypothetical protein
MLAVVAGALRPVLLAALAGVGLLTVLTVLITGPPPGFLVQAAVAVLASGAAYLLDEPSAEVSDVAPRARDLRLALVAATALALLALGWTGLALVLHAEAPAVRLGPLGLEAAALGVAAAAAAAVLRRRGDPTPGVTVATVMVLLVLTETVGGPIRLLLDVLGLDALSSTLLWSALGGGAAVLLVVAARDVASPPLLSRRRPGRPATPGRA